MAVYHFRNGGSMTGAAGPSTPDDWSLANCYGVNENRWNDVMGQLGDGDYIILYDVEGGVTTHNFGSPNNASVVSAGTIMIRSRSGDARWCEITCDGSAPVIDFTKSGVTQNYIFYGVRPRFSSNTAQPMFRALNDTGDITFSMCHIGPFEYGGASGSGFGGGILMNFNVDKNLEFIDSVIEDVSGIFDDAMLVRHSGASGGVIISGAKGLEVRNVSVVDQNGQFDGVIYLPSGAALTSCSRLYLEEIRVVGNTASHRAFGGVYSESGAINATLIHGKRVLVECKQGGGLLVGSDAVAVNIDTIFGEECEMVTDGSENDPGGVVFAFNGGTVNIGKLETRRCFAPFGTGIYWGSGAGGRIRQLIAIENDARESSAAAYCGGYADQRIDSLLALRCGHRGAQSSSDAHPSVLLARLSTLGATGAKTLTIGQATIVGCTSADPAYPMVRINSSNPSHALNVDCFNWLMDNEAGKVEIEYAEDHATAELNLTIAGLKTPNGASDVHEDLSAPIANGSFDLSAVLAGISTLQDGLSDLDCGPVEPDAQIGGLKWWTGEPIIGVDDEPFPSFGISLGAVQSKLAPFHPSRL